jgi:hypothetical protein
VAAGLVATIWSYMVVTGAHELLRRKFDWARGRKYSNEHLLAGTVAVCVGIIVGGAFHETMPMLAIVPALSAIKQASDGHETKRMSLVHLAITVVGLSIGTWFYIDGVIGGVLLEKIGISP